MTKRSLLVLACCGIALLACETQSIEGPSRNPPLLHPAFDEAAAEEASVAGPPMAELEEIKGTCPDGFTLIEVKFGDPSDTNGNGYICTDGKRFIDDLVSGACPFGFELVPVKIGDPIDSNRNGYACFDGRTFVDDTVKGPDADTEWVGGHGNLVFPKQDISFSFHGKQNKQLVIKGEFEMHDQISDVRIHGDVTCLRVEANQARLGGVVTQSTDPKVPVGSAVTWFAADNGEGLLDKPDLLSRPSLGKDPKNDCHRLIKLAVDPILNGNIQVLH